MLADQCNKGLPLLAEPKILLSRVKEVPVLQSIKVHGAIRVPKQHQHQIHVKKANEDGMVHPPLIDDAEKNNDMVHLDDSTAHEVHGNIQRGNEKESETSTEFHPKGSTTGTRATAITAPCISFISAQHNRALSLLGSEELKRREEKRQKMEVERKEAVEALQSQKERYLAILQGKYPSDSSAAATNGSIDAYNDTSADTAAADDDTTTTSNNNDTTDIPVDEDPICQPIALSQLLIQCSQQHHAPNTISNANIISQQSVSPTSNAHTTATATVTPHAAASSPSKTQQMGGEPAARRQEIIRIFCVEKLNERSNIYYRNFAATSYSWLWHTYMSSPPPSLHWYEVIREGRPCHLYFDLEYGKGPTWNEAVNGDELVDRLVHYVNEQLQ